MITAPPVPTEVLNHPIDGRGLGSHQTLGALLDARSGPTLLVFLRHHG
ncbi:MAG: hypothetical protein AAFO29_03480 [Actinomycetota bacterium]